MNLLPLDSATFPLEGQQIIEASAGTGKTYTITNLYLRLLLEGDSPRTPRQILVLTFTIAATDELRQRIRGRISEAKTAFSNGSSEDEFLQGLIDRSTNQDTDRKRLAAALQMMDEAAIFTIHGFCARVLGELAFDTGVLFSQDLEGDSEAILKIAVEDTFRLRIQTLPHHVREVALGLWPTPTALLAATRSYLFRHNLSVVPPANNKASELSDFYQKIRELKTRWVNENIEQLLLDSDIAKNSAAYKRLPKMQDFCANTSYDIGLLEAYTDEGLQKARKKTGPEIPTHPVFDLIHELWESQSIVSEVGYELWHQVLQDIRNHLNQYKARTHQLTIDDLLVEVHRALGKFGDSLVNTLRLKWPVAMIDEFQDTDDLQYEIFTRIYGTADDGGLFMIGDPKQAIYQFRGADIYTYLNARQLIEGDGYSLTTNWRSTPELIAAINHLFTRPDVFGEDIDIEYQAVDHAQKNEGKALTMSGQSTPPVTLFSVDIPDANKDLVRYAAMDHAAEETALLLSGAKQGQILVDGKPLEAGQIAFLVREKKDAREARRALASRGIRSTYVTLDSVLLSDTASDLQALLTAISDPSNEQAIKTALATRLMQVPMQEIDALNHDLLTQQRVIDEFQTYFETWSNQSVGAMIEQVMKRRNIAQHWFLQPDGERQITNLRHLSELLERRSASTPGMHRLMRWFQLERTNAETLDAEERQLRLESDQDLVKIVTMHASKGLEYDVVMIPMAGFGDRTDSKPFLIHHQQDGQYQAVLDLAGTDSNANLQKQESLNEYMRLLYVAITRAKYQCYVGIPLYKGIEKTALARLLDFSDSDSLQNQLEQLPSELFKIQRQRHSTHTNLETTMKVDDLVAPPTLPATGTRWHIHSYTSMARLLNSPDVEFSHTESQPGIGDDDRATTEPDSFVSQYSRFHFPRGPRIGIGLHDLLENLSFQATDTDINHAATRLIHRVGLKDELEPWLPAVEAWITDILRTPIDLNAAGAAVNQEPSTTEVFRLSDIQNRDRLNELEFHFPVNVDPALIPTMIKAGYLAPDLALSQEHLTGVMTGYIDLTIRHGGKFYLLDYKSNDLGLAQAHYDHTGVAEAVQHHHYDLQYLIYTVALHRYLQQVVPDYDYESHFGGVAYLFLRGMNGEVNSGTFVDRPSFSLITELDKLL